MRKKRFFAILLILFIIGIAGFLIFNYFQKKQANLEVNSNLHEEVFVDGTDVGATSLTYNTEPKEVTIQIGNYQTRVSLLSGIKTIIERDFNSDKSESWGSVLSFENTGLTQGTLAVVSEPSGAQVKVDEKVYGVTPISIEDLSATNHKLNISLEGYMSKDYSINIYKAYKLTAYIDLQNSPSTLAKPSTDKPALSDQSEVFVKILSTPNGFLRVRKEPNTASSEIARVHEGEQYLLKQLDKKTGWYNIQLNASASGWISDIYAATESAKAD